MARYQTKPVKCDAWPTNDIAIAATTSRGAMEALDVRVVEALDTGRMRVVKFWQVDGPGLIVYQKPGEEPLQAPPGTIVSVDERGEWYVWEAAVFAEVHEEVRARAPMFAPAEGGEPVMLTSMEAIRERLVSIGDPHVLMMNSGANDVFAAVGAAAARDTSLDPLMLPADEPKRDDDSSECGE